MKYYEIEFKNKKTLFMSCADHINIGDQIIKWGDSELSIDNVKSCNEIKKNEPKNKLREVKVKGEWLEKEKVRDEERLKAEAREVAERKARKAEEKAAKEEIKKERAEAAEKQKEHDEKVKLMGEILKHNERKSKNG